MIRGFLITVTLLVGLAFAVMNTSQTVVIKFFLGFSTQEVPVYQLVVGGFLAGMFLSAILVLPEWVKLKWELKKQKKAFLKIEKQINRVRPSREEAVPETHDVPIPGPGETDKQP
ncbi:MAG TPA: LapA family protein [Nitrospiria bacterium]